jgi:hypothetical protein
MYCRLCKSDMGKATSAPHRTRKSRLRDPQPESAWFTLTHVTCDHRETATKSEEQHFAVCLRVLLYCNVFCRCPDPLHAPMERWHAVRLLCRHDTHIYVYSRHSHCAQHSIASPSKPSPSKHPDILLFLPSRRSVLSVLAAPIVPAIVNNNNNTTSLLKTRNRNRNKKKKKRNPTSTPQIQQCASKSPSASPSASASTTATRSIPVLHGHSAATGKSRVIPEY